MMRQLPADQVSKAMHAGRHAVSLTEIIAAGGVYAERSSARLASAPRGISPTVPAPSFPVGGGGGVTTSDNRLVDVNRARTGGKKGPGRRSPRPTGVVNDVPDASAKGIPKSGDPEGSTKKITRDEFYRTLGLK